MSIFIFSRPIHSGKTTELMNWCEPQKNCAGILMPDVDGLRKMYDIKANLFFEAECKNPLTSNEELLSIGKYRFYANAFEQANYTIITALSNNPDWLIIDEIGKLELDKKGFYPSVKQTIESISNKEFDGNLFLVVRENLLKEVIAFFEIKDFEVLNHLPL